MAQHRTGLSRSGTRWCSSEELERLRRDVELGGDPESKAKLIRAEKRAGIREVGNRVPNLDLMTETELRRFWRRYSEPTRKEAERLIGDNRPGYMKYTKWLANYAWHIAEAQVARLNGAINSATVAERFAQSIYDDLPEDLRW